MLLEQNRFWMIGIMMHRRAFVRGLGMAVGMALLSPLPCIFAKTTCAADSSTAEEPSVLPILMFHKVDDSLRFPEDLSTTQFQNLFDSLWKQGFYPVNMSDILTNQVDAIVPAGKKPIGITADDAHRSVFFSKSTASHLEQRNNRSLVTLLCDSVQPYGFAPRATLFLSCVGDDRVSRKG